MVDSDDISFDPPEGNSPFWPDPSLLLQLVFVPLTICFFVLIATGLYFLME